MVSSRGFPPAQTLAKFNMDKNVSIVKVDKRHYRVIARENWGLTKEQMKGKHVHHRIKRSEGGTNDPSNLYVCSEWFHDNVWHAGEGGFAGCAFLGAKKAHQNRDEQGRSITGVKGAKKLHERKDETGKSVVAVKAGRVGGRSGLNGDENYLKQRATKGGRKLHEEKDENGKSLRNVKLNEKLHAEKNENGKSFLGVENGRRLNSQLWESTIDGFKGNAGNVAQHNQRNGWNPKAKVRAG